MAKRRSRTKTKTKRSKRQRTSRRKISRRKTSRRKTSRRKTRSQREEKSAPPPGVSRYGDWGTNDPDMHHQRILYLMRGM